MWMSHTVPLNFKDMPDQKGEFYKEIKRKKQTSSNHELKGLPCENVKMMKCDAQSY